MVAVFIMCYIIWSAQSVTQLKNVWRQELPLFHVKLLERQRPSLKSTIIYHYCTPVYIRIHEKRRYGLVRLKVN